MTKFNFFICKICFLYKQQKKTNKININNYTRKNQFTLRKRKESFNNTHNNLVDESIEAIVCFKYVKFYYIKLILYNLLTLGLLSIFCRIFRKLQIKVFCIPSDVYDTELFLVEDHEKRFFIVDALRENFNKKYKFLKSENYKNKEIISKDSHFIGEEGLNKSCEAADSENIILYFKNNKYIYLESICGFAAVQLDLGKFTNAEIYKNFSEGVKSLAEYNYLLNKFGENMMRMKEKTLFQIVGKKFFTPLIIYRIYIVFIWIVNKYYSFLIVVAVLSIILLLISSYQKYLNYKRVFNKNDSFEIRKMEEVI